MRRLRFPTDGACRRLTLALAMAFALVPADARAQGVATALSPAAGFVAPGAEFDVDFVVPAAGASFNGFHATFSYDPAAITFLQATPVSAQRGCLMTGGCSTACGTTFHLFQAAGDSLVVDLSLLCDQVALSGPGQLYRLHFLASNTAQVTHVSTRSARFLNAGLFVTPGTTADSHIVIGSPAGVEPGAIGDLAVRIGAEPNPARGSVALSLASPRDGVQDVDVLDLSGRMVRRLSGGWQARGTRRLAWDGADAGGSRVPPGVYLVRLRMADQQASTRVTMIR